MLKIHLWNLLWQNISIELVSYTKIKNMDILYKSYKVYIRSTLSRVIKYIIRVWY